MKSISGLSLMVLAAVSGISLNASAFTYNRAAPPSRLAVEAAAAGAVEFRVIGTCAYAARECTVGIYMRPLGQDFARDPEARRLIRTVKVDFDQLSAASRSTFSSSIDPAPHLQEAQGN